MEADVAAIAVVTVVVAVVVLVVDSVALPTSTFDAVAPPSRVAEIPLRLIEHCSDCDSDPDSDHVLHSVDASIVVANSNAPYARFLFRSSGSPFVVTAAISTIAPSSVSSTSPLSLIPGPEL